MIRLKWAVLIAALSVITSLTVTPRIDATSDAVPSAGINDMDTWASAIAKLPAQKTLIELEDVSLIIEVNATDADAGFQVFLDGEGWQIARVFSPNGRQILHVFAGGGLRKIGGGTELFLESQEPEFENIDEFQELIELLPEGEYFFLATTTTGDRAVGMAELTHDVPAGPVIVAPVPADGEECASDVSVSAAVIEWNPVTTQLTGDPAISIAGYQVIVENEDTEREFVAELAAETIMVTISPEFLAPATEYSFEILAIEESGNQTITESCFETAA